jgi:hypothetical protein
MTKRQGSKNYSNDEMRCLLAYVQRHLPATRAEWEALAADYSTAKEAQWNTRDAVSLKRKFRSMSVASGGTGTELAATTKEVLDMLHQHNKLKQRTAPSPVASATQAELAGEESTRTCAALTEPTPEQTQVAGSYLAVGPAKQLTPSHQLQKIFRQRKADRRASKRRHHEIRRSIMQLKVIQEKCCGRPYCSQRQ